MSIRLGGHGVWWVLLGVYGVAADMFLIVAGIALVGIGVVFAFIGFFGNIIRQKKPLVIVSAVAIVISGACLLRGLAFYNDYLPTYRVFQQAMAVEAEQDSHPPPTTTMPK